MKREVKSFFVRMAVVLPILITTLLLFQFMPLANDEKQVAVDTMPPHQGLFHKANELDMEANIKESITEAAFIQVKKDGWQLIWQDEFEENKLDESKWNTENWAAEKNNELQFYSPNNVTVEDGQLKLISKKERYQGRDYTSGAIHSKDKFSFRYGRAEMRAKLPIGQGIFPAFWMLPNLENTWLPEIDIIEMLGHKPNEIWMVTHWLDEKSVLSSTSTMHKGDNYSNNFHTYSVEWTPTSITWFIDGIERFHTEEFSPNVDMYLYLNTAVGGDWPGRPDETTRFPQSFEVDYVRVYQKVGER